MAKIDDLIPLVQAKAPTAPRALIRSALIRSSREFFRASRFWSETCRGTLRAGQSYSVLDSAKGTEFVQVQNLTIGGRETFPLREIPMEIDERQPTAAAVGYQGGEPGLFFNGEAVEDLGFSVRLALIPSLAATKIDDAAVSLWGEYIADGACAELMIQPNKAWSDPNMSQYLARSFSVAILKAKNARSNGFATERQTVSRRKWV